MPIATACRRPVMVLTLLCVGACLGHTELVSPPQEPVTSVTLRFQADSEDATTAAALGWANGIPGAQVTVTAGDTTAGPPRLFQSADSGTLFLDQLAGRYTIDVERWLTDSERARLPAGDDAVGFVGHTVLLVSNATAQTPVAMIASRRMSLVVSEWKGDPLFTTAEGTYFGSEYFRIYNNSDTTVYLDGVIFGDGMASQFDYPNFPCTLYAPYALDPRGIWALRFHQVPGAGRDYPLAPGATAVIATDAIDHRPLFSEGLDLRHANFEVYEGAGDIDNPAVPNTIRLGWGDPTGHGVIWSVLGKVVFLSSPTDVSALPTAFVGNVTWVRFPAEALLDVMAIKTNWQAPEPECSRLVNPRFDRQHVQLIGAKLEDDLLAYRRIPIPFTIGGRPVLQHTHTSAWDFTVKPRDPFAVP